MPHFLARLSKKRPLTVKEQEELRAYWRMKEQLRNKRKFQDGRRLQAKQAINPMPAWLLTTSGVSSLEALRRAFKRCVPTRRHVMLDLAEEENQ